MSSQPASKIGHSLGALQQLSRLLAGNPKVLAKLCSTQADRDYLTGGLSLAVRQLQFFREHQVAIEAAISAYRQRAEAATKSESVAS